MLWPGQEAESVKATGAQMASGGTAMGMGKSIFGSASTATSQDPSPGMQQKDRCALGSTDGHT